MLELNEINFTYLLQPPKKYTFEQPKLKQWTESWCNGLVLNLFAGKVLLDVNEVRNDIDPNMPADDHLDAFTYLGSCIGVCKFDTIILDPPYNIRKAREKYNGRYIGKLTKIKNILPKILNDNGRVISLGYDSVGMAKCRGFKKIALCLVCHGGDHNDTICLVEEYERSQLKLEL